MAEGTATLPSGVEIAYSTFGKPESPPLLMVMGLGGPSIWWHDDLCTDLAARGFHVIRYDNRDVGWSTYLRHHHVRRRHILRAFLGHRSLAPYTIDDMVEDAFGLLDHLDVESAHLCGVSMGGMIAQAMAITEPHRVRSLVSIMSTTGRRTVGWQDPRLLPMLVGRSTRDRDAYVAQSVRVWNMIGSPGYPEDPAEKARRAGLTWDRGVSLAGTARQMMAVLAQTDRTRALRDLDIPALVIHGLADRMVHVSGGRATAAAIPGAELQLIPGMGHDLPRALHPVFVEGIVRTARRAGETTVTDDPRPAPPSVEAPTQPEATSSSASISSRASRR